MTAIPRPRPNLAELLAQAAREAPDGTALVEGGSGRSVTWSELDAEADRVAHGLQELGLVAGNRVVLSLPNRVEMVAAYFAVLRARLVAVPVNPRAATGELVRVVADAGARLALADTTTLTVLRSAVAGLQDALLAADEDIRSRTPVPHIVALDGPVLPGETPYADLAGSGGAPVVPAPDAAALAVILYTSGTSGRPRGAMLSHRALGANIEQVAAVRPPLVRPDDVVLGVLPLFHVYGLNAVLGQVVRQHASLVLVDAFDAERTLDLVAGHRVSVLPIAPAVLAHWRRIEDLRERLATVRLVLSGSAPLAPEVAEEFTSRTGLVVHQGYGLTEAAPVVTSTLVGGGVPKRSTVGRAVPGVRMRLVDESGREPEGEDPGEIQVAGENLFEGYWPDASDGPRDGWMATGDVGLIDAEGDLFLLDRLKDLVVVSGFNVYPSEVEEVVGEVEGVVEAAVIGVPDEQTGEAVVAYVRVGPAHDPAAVADAVRAHCGMRLARFKLPREVHVVDQLPHTVSGQVAKGTLRVAARRRTVGLLE